VQPLVEKVTEAFILPELHYGRDALVGIALILTHLAKTGLSVSALRKTYPDYFMAKKKISLKTHHGR
jgi:phosphomannomutase